MSDTLPDFMTPEYLARLNGWSPRHVRKVARALGACLILGNRMSLTRKDAEAILAYSGADVSAELARTLPPRPVRPHYSEATVRGVIYFIQCAGWIKIGWSSKLKKRIQQIQTHAPAEIKLIGKIRGTIKQEREFHQRFAKYRTSGEWFTASEEILEFIRSSP